MPTRTVQRVMRCLGLAASLLAFSSAAADRSSVLGVWKGNLGGLPAVTLTVEQDGDKLIGAILFYMIRRGADGSRTASPGSPEPLLEPHLNGTILAFKVSHKNAHPPRTLNDPPVSFQLELQGADKAVLRTESTPPLEMVRVQSPGSVLFLRDLATTSH